MTWHFVRIDSATIIPLVPTTGTAFPHSPIVAFPPGSTNLTPAFDPLTGDDLGHDVVLNNVIGFDVQVYDPLAPVVQGTQTIAGQTVTTALVPSDNGWVATGGTEIGRGAYVDLNYSQGDRSLSFYSGQPNAPAGKACLPVNPPIYDTWPLHYERDGIDQNNGGSGAIDEGNNGFDDGGLPNTADDIGEYETSPPYPHPLTGARTPGLSGLQVKLRIFEPDTRQVRQVTVATEFCV